MEGGKEEGADYWRRLKNRVRFKGDESIKENSKKWVLVFESGDEVIASLKKFADDNRLASRPSD
jgi:hypothetical protein